MKEILGDTYNYLEAENGNQAIQMIGENIGIDLMLLDINMPKMNGLELLEQLQKNRIRMKIVMVSTLTKEGAQETITALERGAFDFVTKPENYLDAKQDGFKNRLLEKLCLAVNLPFSVSTAEDQKNTAGKFRTPGAGGSGLGTIRSTTVSYTHLTLPTNSRV